MSAALPRSGDFRESARFLLERLEARQLAALDELERGAAAGGDVAHLGGEAHLLDGGGAIAAADHRGAIDLAERLRDGASALRERGHLEEAHRAVPEHGL